jgi:hypothetical protein
MTTKVIRKKLTDYLKVADDDKVKAIYTMVADEINTAENDWDEGFVKELKIRSRSYTNGTAKTYSWEETKAAAVKKVKLKNR